MKKEKTSKKSGDLEKKSDMPEYLLDGVRALAMMTMSFDVFIKAAIKEG